MERKEMIFGKKFKAGNFTYIKTNTVLPKKDMETLRDNDDVPKAIRKQLRRVGLPCITVKSISENWMIRYAVGTVMYDYIEFEHGNGEEGQKSLASLFTMMYSDTMVFGDQQYWEDKAKALQAFMDRQKKDVDKSTDDEDLNALRTQEEAKATIIDMAKEVKDES